MEKLTTYTKIAIMLILALLLKNCRENVRKEERFGPRAPISEKLTYQLKNNKWKLRRYRVIDQSKGEIIHKKDIDNIVLSFNEEKNFKREQILWKS